MARQYEDVMRELLDAIVGGDHAEGDWLPSVDELRTSLGASRNAVREALRGLEERGLIAVRAGRGHTITQRECWDTRAPDVLRACIERGPDPEVLPQAIDARALVERAAARHACASATDADLRLLRSRVDMLQRALEPGAPRTLGIDDAFVVAEVWFHRTLAALSENPVLATLIEPLHAVLAEVRRVRAPERDGTALLHHQRIVEGLLSRDPDLAEAAVAGYARQLRRGLGVRR
jgi:GntR family transcriptional repressor for pyruvate dehydrogenase complex